MLNLQNKLQDLNILCINTDNGVVIPQFRLDRDKQPTINNWNNSTSEVFMQVLEPLLPSDFRINEIESDEHDKPAIFIGLAFTNATTHLESLLQASK